MASPLEGAIAATINSAFQNLFINATLTRGVTVYTCKAIFDKWQKFLRGPDTASTYQILVLADSLAIQPLINDIITLQGITALITSDIESKPAIEIDPAGAVWILRSRYIETYTRFISIYRENQQLVAGNAGYLGHSRSTETLLFSGIASSLQCQKVGTQRSGDGRLVDDPPGPVRWDVYISSTDIAKGQIVSRDIIVDDEANRYQVVAAYWTPAGWKIQTIRLEA